jgi:hypothetical protein
MFYSTRPTFWWILPNEIFWPSLFTKLLFRNISGVILLYDQSVKSWEFRIREIWYCWEGNTMLLRGKYNVLINVTWDCFDQSNFYISRINIIEWNNIYYYMTINISFIRLVKSMRFCLDITWWILSKPSICTTINFERSRGAFGTIY